MAAMAPGIGQHETMPLYRELPENTLGRDFIVGDLHGCGHLLLNALERARFDPAHDRVFSVGDLVDRGPDSLGTLMLLAKPWFYAVRGNHEDMLLSYLGIYEDTPYTARDFFENGGSWVLDLTERQRKLLREALGPMVRALPYVIRVGGAHPFQVVHAQLDEAVPQRFQDWLAVIQDEQWLARNRVDLAWSRRLANRALAIVERFWRVPWGGVNLDGKRLPDGSITYVGHTVVPFPIQLEGHLFLDGGAYLETQAPQQRPVYRGKRYGKLFLYNHTEQRFV